MAKHIKSCQDSFVLILAARSLAVERNPAINKTTLIIIAQPIFVDLLLGYINGVIFKGDYTLQIMSSVISHRPNYFRTRRIEGEMLKMPRSLHTISSRAD